MKSDAVKKGAQQAPHRSLFNALGYTKEEMDRPLVGIVSSYNEIVPGHMNIDKIVNAVKLGVAMAGGTPVVFPAIAVCDGIAMGHSGMKYSLVTRDLIADSTECMALAHQFDALVMVPNCDKNVPGLLMAAARINVPTIFVSGGPMLAFKKCVTSVVPFDNAPSITERWDIDLSPGITISPFKFFVFLNTAGIIKPHLVCIVSIYDQILFYHIHMKKHISAFIKLRIISIQKIPVFLSL